MKSCLTWDIENKYIGEGYTLICGTDEAGRGPLFGPVAAAACILPHGLVIDALTDSKKMTERKRDEVYDIIIQNAVAYAIELVSASEIDEINILNASQLAMRRAVFKLHPKPDLVLVDGNIARDFPIDAITVIKGDSKSPNIAAASVLAKVTRDRLCYQYDDVYPEYGLAAHKGYPTKAHMDAVRKFGPTEQHRKTFLKFLDK